MDNILEAKFGTVVILLLTEMKEHTEVVALDTTGNVYHIDSLIEEIKQNTMLAQEAAKVIIGTAFEIAARNSDQNHEKRKKEAKRQFDHFMEKYGNWLVKEEDREEDEV